MAGTLQLQLKDSERRCDEWIGRCAAAEERLSGTEALRDQSRARELSVVHLAEGSSAQVSNSSNSGNGNTHQAEHYPSVGTALRPTESFLGQPQREESAVQEPRSIPLRKGALSSMSKLKPVVALESPSDIVAADNKVNYLRVFCCLPKFSHRRHPNDCQSVSSDLSVMYARAAEQPHSQASLSATLSRPGSSSDIAQSTLPYRAEVEDWVLQETHSSSQPGLPPATDWEEQEDDEEFSDVETYTPTSKTIGDSSCFYSASHRVGSDLVPEHGSGSAAHILDVTSSFEALNVLQVHEEQSGKSRCLPLFRRLL